MRRRTAAVLLVLDIAGMLLLVAVLGVSWQAGQSLLHPERDLEARTPSEAGLSWMWANTTTADGVALAGWWLPADATPEDNLTTLFLHGYGDAKSQGLELFPFLLRHGNVLAIDQRAHGASGGDYTTAGKLEVLDVQAALAWLHQRVPPTSPVVLLGWSMGGATALNFAGQWGPLASTFGIAGVVTDGAFSRLTRIVETSIGAFTGLPAWPFGPLATTFAGWSVGQSLEANAPADAVRNAQIPLLLIHGEADTTVTPDQLGAIAAAAPGAATWRIPGARHVESYATASSEYEARVGDFLDDVALGFRLQHGAASPS